jgi:hypothetical protein
MLHPASEFLLVLVLFPPTCVRADAMWLVFYPLLPLGAVRRPAILTHSIGFEGLTTNCDFAAAKAPIYDEYAERDVSFSGPGFGIPIAPNGGVAMDGCALWDGAFPPLGNGSFDGRGFLGFSAAHSFHERTGKPIAPETLRFDARMTNIKASFAGLDGHPVNIEVWSGPGSSYNDGGELLETFSIPMSTTLSEVELADKNGIYVDCIRRLVISSPSKIFVLDNLQYDVTSADDAICGPEPGRPEPAAPPPPRGLAAAMLDAATELASSSAAPARPTGLRSSKLAAGCIASAVAFLVMGRTRSFGAQHTRRRRR